MLRICGVEHKYRYVFVDGRLDGEWVQHLSTEVSHFGSFFKRDLVEAFGVFNAARVGSAHAVDVGPNFNALGINSHADERCGVVAAATSEHRRLAVDGRRNESLSDYCLHAFVAFFDYAWHAVVNLIEDWVANESVAAGDYHLAGVD